MTFLLIYLLAVILIAILGFFVVLSFWRYRFKGDKTALIVTLFAIAFLATVIATFLLYQPVSSQTPVSTFSL